MDEFTTLKDDEIESLSDEGEEWSVADADSDDEDADADDADSDLDADDA
jgi:hypothetical protein